jgi:SAM-dependent methyltransferase
MAARNYVQPFFKTARLFYNHRMPDRYFTKKAAKYARYRWDYPPSAIAAVLARAGLSPSSIIADLGAGTGMVAKHFLGKSAQVIALDIDPAMLRFLAPQQGLLRVVAAGENVPLPAASVDLVTVGQAIHWFQPEPARREILRILKPGGWLAIFRNQLARDPSDAADSLGSAIESLTTPEYGGLAQHPAPGVGVAPEFHFGSGSFERLVFPFTFQQDWETFFGSLTSASYMPDEEHLLYPKLETAALAVFERFCILCSDGVPRLPPAKGETELVIGRPK